jgi:hypothetical protein
MSWQQGRAIIERLLDEHHLEQVPANPDLAQALLDQAKSHLTAAEREADLDPYVAYSALYDAARKALAALLQMQGLRPTSAGGHLTVLEAAQAQLDPPLGALLRPLERMRCTRHAAECPTSSTAVTPTTYGPTSPRRVR